MRENVRRAGFWVHVESNVHGISLKTLEHMRQRLFSTPPDRRTAPARRASLGRRTTAMAALGRVQVVSLKSGVSGLPDMASSVICSIDINWPRPLHVDFFRHRESRSSFARCLRIPFPLSAIHAAAACKTMITTTANNPKINASTTIRASISNRNSFLTFSSSTSPFVTGLLALEYRRFKKCHVTIADITVETTATALVINVSDPTTITLRRRYLSSNCPVYALATTPANSSSSTRISPVISLWRRDLKRSSRTARLQGHRPSFQMISDVSQTVSDISGPRWPALAVGNSSD